MIGIAPVTINDLPIIQDIAYRTWPATFGEILSADQITYMMAMMYSPEALREQIEEKGHIFLLAADPNIDQNLGYVSYELNYQGQPATKIHKLYVLPESQGKGVGQALISIVAIMAQQHNNESLWLNVNRHNKAIRFYERQGFSVMATETINIGNGYVMDDVVMKKPL